MNQNDCAVPQKQTGLFRASYLFALCIVFALVPSIEIQSQPAVGPNLDHVEALWIGQENRLTKLAVKTGDTLVDIANRAVGALAIDEKRQSVWVYGGGVLTSYAFDGSLLQSIVVNNNKDDDSKSDDDDSKSDDDNDSGDLTKHSALTVDTVTGMVWLGVKKTLHAFSPFGELLSTHALNAKIVDLAFDAANRQVWAASKKNVISFELSLIEEFRLDLPSSAKVTALTLDPRDGTIWVAGKKEISRYQTDGSLLSRLPIEKADHLAADGRGGLWVAVDKRLDLIDIDRGTVRLSIEPFNKKRKIEALALQRGGDSVWTAAKQLATRIDSQGQTDKAFTVPGKIRALAHYRDLVSPQIEIVAPTAATPVNTLRPQIVVDYTDSGIGADPDTLTFDLDGSALSVGCEFNASGATCLPAADILDGTHELTATIEDFAGNVGESQSVQVEVDTIAPQLTLTSPPPDLVTDQASVVVSGSVSEPATVTINGAATVVSPDAPFVFSATVSLNEGANTITITATDKAENKSTLTRTVTFDPNDPPTITSAPITEVTQFALYTYDVNATDPNGDPLNFALTNAPAGMGIDSNSGVIQWMPQAAGTFNVTIVVNDGRGGSASQSFTINVIPANRPPQIVSLPITTATIDQAYIYDVAATDPDNDDLRFALRKRPLGMAIDAATGLITWTPAVSATVNVEVQAQDPGGLVDTQSFQISVAFAADNQPPTLAPVADQIAPLGQILEIQLVGNDPEDQPLAYSVGPLPLPAGTSLNARTGVFRFAPAASAVGVLTFTFAVSDGRFQALRTVTITVPPAGVVTTLRGQVLTLGNQPLKDVRLEVGGASVFSDANGNFFFPSLLFSGQQRILIDGGAVDSNLGSFATVPETVQLVAGANNVMPNPIILLPLDKASADKVDPFLTTKITSRDIVIDGVNHGPVTLTIPPRMGLVDATGELYDGLISITRIPDASLGPTPLPDDIDLSIYIAVQPFGITYVEPVPISFPNVENFPPGTIVDIFGLNHATGVFEKVGEGRVSANGKTVDSIGGVVRNNSWHGFVPRPATVNGPAGPGCGCPGGDCDCEDQGTPGSSYGFKTGFFSETHDLVAYRSLSQARGLTLEYHSTLAEPKPIIEFDAQMGLPAPRSLSHKLSVAGIEQGVELFMEPGGLNTLLRPAIQFDANEFETGVYTYTYTLNCRFAISRRGTSVSGDVVVNNRSASAFGAGWTLAGLHRLHPNESGAKVLLTTGTRGIRIFERNDLGVFEPPRGDTSVLVDNPDGSFTRTLKNGTVYQFNSAGFLVSIADRNDNTTAYAYDSQNRLISVTDPVGLITRFDYQSGKLVAITDPAARITRFTQDSEGNLITIQDPDGSVRRFEYGSVNHRMTAKLDKRGNRFDYEYDFAGRFKRASRPDGSVVNATPEDVQGLVNLEGNVGTALVPAPPPPNSAKVDSIMVDGRGNGSRVKTDDFGQALERTDELGRKTILERDVDGNITKTTRPDGSIVSRTFDDRNNLLTDTEGFNGATTTNTYDPQFSLITSTTDPRGKTTTFNRDARGNLITQINHLGHTTTMQYDNQGLVTQMTDPNGLVTTFEYSLQGLLITKTETPPPGGGATRITRFEYDAAGNVTKRTQPDGVELTLTYDANGRVLTITDNLGQVIDSTYDEQGNLIKTETRNVDGTVATVVETGYDQLNRSVRITRPHTADQVSETTFEYDLEGNLVKTIDPNSNALSSVYDSANQLTRQIDAAGGVTAFEYDELGNMISVTAPNGAKTTFEVDPLSRRTKEISPDRGTLTNTYDLANNLLTTTDARGINSTFVYDDLNRVTEIQYPDSTENVTSTNDTCEFGTGRLCARSDESGSYTFSYDAFGNLLRQEYTALGVTYTTRYEYDEGHNLIAMTYPDGKRVIYVRDELKRIKAIAATVNGSESSIISNVEYRADGVIIGKAYGNGTTETRAYDRQSRLTRQQIGTVDAITYQYDKNGNVLIRNTRSVTHGYGYDELDRLVQDILDGVEPIQYSYDPNHNRLTRQQSQTTAQYFYEAATNKLLTVDETNLGIGANGNTTQGPDNRLLTYNDANRIDQIAEAGTLVANYVYNANGQRKVKTLSDGATTLYHYDLQGNLITETTQTGEPIRSYIWQDGQPVAQIDVTAVETVTYLHTDHLATPRLGTNQSQTIVWQWESEAFGESEPAGPIEINLRFPGQYADEESGLYYNWNRYYDPQTGRYITSDPLGVVIGLNIDAQPNVPNNIKMFFAGMNTQQLLLDGINNTYGYVKANPLGIIDPTGLAPPRGCDKPDCSPKRKRNCEIKCNLISGVFCTAIGVGVGVVLTPATGIAVGMLCRVTDYFLCKAECDREWRIDCL